MMLIFQAFLVMAAEPSTYRTVAMVNLPPQGAVRVALPPGAIGASPSELDRGLLLVDAQGQGVPYAVVRSSGSEVFEEEDLVVRPRAEGGWETSVSEAPADALRLDLPAFGADRPIWATVSWPVADGWRSTDPVLLYALDGEEVDTVPVPHVTGPFRVQLDRADGWRPLRIFNVEALRYAADHVPENRETFPMPVAVTTEDGRARYTLRLPGVRSVRGLRFSLPPEADVLDREVTVRTPTASEWEFGASAVGRIRRLQIGDARVDRLTLRFDALVGDTLVIEIPLERQAPPDLGDIEVYSEGAILVARDAGAGPHTLYADATELDQAYDLSVALPELLRMRPPLLPAPTMAPNPAFVPLPTREQLDEAGADLSLARYRFERDLQGSGWSRVRLGREILARARADLADLRVVDPRGRMLPFLLRETSEEEEWTVEGVERSEDKGSTRLKIPLSGSAPVSTLRLRTTRGVFARPVTVLRDAGRLTIPIRRVDWVGPERGSRLVLDIGERVDDGLIVQIDNGDDAPLPIEGVQVSTRVWELRVRIPDDGARLVYGAPGADRPDFDLGLLEDEVRRMSLSEATLGEERALSLPAPSWVDRGAAAAGVGLLVLGLLGMAVRVLRGVSAPDATPG
jgi:hypothetical protein